MRLSVFLITALLVSSGNSQQGEGYKVIQDGEHTASDDLRKQLNALRSEIATELNAVSMYELIPDASLAALANKAMESCDRELFNDGNFRKVRFTQLESDAGNRTYSFDFLYKRAAFLDHVKRNGASFEKMNLAHLPFYELMYSNQTRIGCVFKVCAGDGPNYDLFNHVCYLGPETTLEGSFIDIVPGKKYTCGPFCPEPRSILSEAQFEREMLDSMNSQRRAFAKQAPAGNMYKMRWDQRLAKVATAYATRCDVAVQETTRYTVFADVPYLHPASFGTQLAKRLIEMPQSMRSDTGHILKAQFWWDHTKFACTQTSANSSCKDTIFCAIGKRKTYVGPMYEEAEPCALCSRECVDGLCLGSPKRNRVRWDSLSPVAFSFSNFFLLCLAVFLFFV